RPTITGLRAGPKEPKQAPLSPDYVLGLEYPEYLAPSDIEILVEDQPHAADALPTTLSLGYIIDSDPEDESEDGPTDYPADIGDDDDDSLGMMLTTRTRRRPLRRMRRRST
ncbi:hypothetical protein Tco_0135444, partial [Tanacetum coccineum]